MHSLPSLSYTGNWDNDVTNGGGGSGDGAILQ